MPPPYWNANYGVIPRTDLTYWSALDRITVIPRTDLTYWSALDRITTYPAQTSHTGARWTVCLYFEG